MSDFRFHAGNFEGIPIYRDIPDKEWDELARQGFTPSEIISMYKLEDPYRDC